jgi:hypothetical protein
MAHDDKRVESQGRIQHNLRIGHELFAPAPNILNGTRLVLCLSQ